MPLTADCHLHSSFSGDSDTPMEEMVRSSIKKGLLSICFTEHLDIGYPVSPTTPDGFFLLDALAYQRECLRLRDKYLGQIEVLFGIELGLIPQFLEENTAFTKATPFDYIIASTHVCEGKDPYMSEFFADRSDREAYREFFEMTLLNVRHYDDFDSYGHLDYVVRYGETTDTRDYYGENKDVIDEILTALVNKGKGLELNTSALRYHLRDLHPNKAIIERFHELGGEIITIGSDAHDPTAIACGFATAATILQAVGFSRYAVFKERKPQFCSL
ncbi:MAG: histidinol-phosphatase HisJ family protein [Lachnospiraceae bacterium]|jgi:histidinol-phosphatase (PHP family)|nr:histidinol-phosphatase HisJ family protein [Lachnospiraceae bacterium]